MAKREPLPPLQPALPSKRELCLIAYRSSCEGHRHPDFIPFSGFCHECFYDFTEGGLVIPAYNTTGCPACHRSYCE